MSDPDSALLDALPATTRAQLNTFARALANVPVEELPLYVARDDDRHVRAFETAERVATEQGLEPGVNAARHALMEAIGREYAHSQLRISGIFGVNMAPTMGPTDVRVRVARSLGEAVTAIVLEDHLEPEDHAELLGLWDRLIP
jgi:hypothetical protein